MNASDEFWISIIADEGPALFRIFEWIVNGLPISPLDERFGVF
jgi:hypothetical protein